MASKAAERLADRVSALEKEVAELKRAVANCEPKKDWRRTIGMFAGDEVMKEIFEEARKIREADRQRAYRRFAKTRKAQSKK